MKTTLDCLVCFYKQALYTARLSTASEERQKEILARLGDLLPQLDLNLSPPENSIQVYSLIARISKVADPFAALKEQSNRQALQVKDKVRDKIATSADPLYSAIVFAIAGNIIDYGSHQEFDLDKTLADCLHRRPVVNDYDKLCDDLQGAERILYLGDNCGELVFDGLLIERLSGKVTMAVKEKPIINDALMSDALACELDKICRLISNGTACPGTPLPGCTPEFQKAFAEADLIISKGQGNFETLSHIERQPPIYFLLTIKCPIVAAYASELAGIPGHLKTGDTVLMQGKKASL